jgi:predicted negative regulator of RcsB-dependent stress response
MLDRGDSNLESLTNIQGGCLLYQAFKAVVSSIKHSKWLSLLSNIQGDCLLYQTFKAAVSSIAAWNA